MYMDVYNCFTEIRVVIERIVLTYDKFNFICWCFINLFVVVIKLIKS